jgi:hypothetical protein
VSVTVTEPWLLPYAGDTLLIWNGWTVAESEKLVPAPAASPP